MEEKKKRFALSGRMKNVVKISSGTMIGKIISFFTFPIIARIYGAEVVGNWTLINSVATIVNSFSDLGLTNAIMVENDEEASLCLYNVVTTIVMGISVISGLIACIYYSVKPSNMGINELFIGILLAVLIFTIQQTQICYTWLNRQGKYEILMKNPIINSTIIGIVAIAFGVAGVKTYGYYIAAISGQIITLIHMKRFLPKKMFTFNPENYQYVFKTKLSFFKYQMPTNVISQVKNQLPVLLIKKLFGAEILGYYSVSVNVLNIPVTLLANALGRVYFQTISDMKRKGEEIGAFTYRNITKAMKVAIIPMIFLIALGDIFIILLYGEDYQMAGTILQTVALQNFFTFLMMSSQGITITLNKQNYAMISCIMQSIGYIVGLGAGAFIFHDIFIGLIIMSIIYILIQIIYFCSLFNVMKISCKKYLIDVVSSIFIILGGAFIVRQIGMGVLSFLGFSL